MAALTGPAAGVRRRSTAAFARTPAAKATSGTLRVLWLGDSVCAGVTFGPAEDPAGDGSDGLHYGGATVQSGVTANYTTDGVTWTPEASWVTSAGGAPLNPGYLPHLCAWALANGYSAVDVRRYGVSGATTPTTRGYFASAWPGLRTLGWVPHLAVPVCGTNDSNNAGEVTLFTTTLPLLYGELEWMWPGVRICHVEPVATTGDKPQSDNIRTLIRSNVAAKATRSYVAGGQGGVHPTLALFRSGGLAIGPAFQAAA